MLVVNKELSDIIKEAKIQPQLTYFDDSYNDKKTYRYFSGLFIGMIGGYFLGEEISQKLDINNNLKMALEVVMPAFSMIFVQSLNIFYDHIKEKKR